MSKRPANPYQTDRARLVGQVIGAFLSAGRTPVNAQEAMSDDHSTYRTTQPGSSDDPAISSLDGMDQPGAPPRDRPPTDRLIGIGEIRQLFGLGRTAAYDLTHRPGFPAPVPVSRNAYRWWASEIAIFTAALRADSQNPSGSPGAGHSSARRPRRRRICTLRATCEPPATGGLRDESGIGAAGTSPEAKVRASLRSGLASFSAHD